MEGGRGSLLRHSCWQRLAVSSVLVCLSFPLSLSLSLSVCLNVGRPPKTPTTCGLTCKIGPKHNPHPPVNSPEPPPPPQSPPAGTADSRGTSAYVLSHFPFHSVKTHAEVVDRGVPPHVFLPPFRGLPKELREQWDTAPSQPGPVERTSTRGTVLKSKAPKPLLGGFHDGEQRFRSGKQKRKIDKKTMFST